MKTAKKEKYSLYLRELNTRLIVTLFKLIRKLTFLSILILSLTHSSKAISPKKYQSLLGVGIDVNWATFNRLIKEKAYKKAWVFKHMGFNAVRIRFKYSKNQKFYFAYLKKCVNSALKSKLIPVLAFAASEFKNNPNKATMERSIVLWKKIAKLFKNYPDKLSFDLIIEPGKNLNKNQKLLNEFYLETINSIRKIDKHRIIFIAPLHASNPYYLNELKLPKDKFIMIEWHFYASGPSKINRRKLWTTGTLYEKSLIWNKVKYAYDWCKKHGIYSWVGAIMPGNYNKGNYYSQKDQIKFMSVIISALRHYHIPFAINADTQFFNYKTDKIKKRKILEYILKEATN